MNYYPNDTDIKAANSFNDFLQGRLNEYELNQLSMEV